jgi:tricorn protease
MKYRHALFPGIGLAACALLGAVSPAPPRPSFAEPSFSPDGRTIVFVSGGDIWTVPAEGGTARLLVSHPATESRPLYSPDGKRLAFASNRTGNGDIYLLTLETGELKRLTFDDSEEKLDAWSRDGKWIYFSSNGRDISGMNDVYRVSPEGGTPMPATADRYVSEFFSAPSPDGAALAFTARGIASSQWWRKGSSHLDESEIWVKREGRYERLTPPGARQMWPMWSPDGKTVYFMSDRGGPQNIWVRSPVAPARALTHFTNGRVLWPSLSPDGRAIVFERNFGLWKCDTATGESAEIPVALQGVPAGPAVEHLSLASPIEELAISPDGKKLAFAIRGEIFAASAKDGGDATRVTRTSSKESQIVWAPDSRRIAYVSDRDGVQHEYLYDFKAGTEARLTNGPSDDAAARFSPDGKLLAFERGEKEIRVLDLASKEERLLATGLLDDALDPGHPLAWSPDGKWVAFLNTSLKLFSNIEVVAISGGASKPVSFLANVFGGSVTWSPDGTYLLFDTGQRTESRQLARIDLVPHAPKFREDQFRELFDEPARAITEKTDKSDKTEKTEKDTESSDAAKKKDAKPTEIVFDGIRQRLSLVPVGVDVREQTVSPDGKWALLVASAAGQENLYIYSLDELAKDRPVAKQLTATNGPKRYAQFSPDSKDVFYLDEGRIQTVSVEKREPKGISVTAELDVDFEAQKREVFHQAWSYLNDKFFDPKFNGVDWEAVRRDYEPQVLGARTVDETRRIINLMIGELNASHCGISAPASVNQISSGRLGLRFDPAEYEASGRLKVTEVIALSPAALAKAAAPGDVLLSVDGTDISARTNLDELLDHKIGKRVTLKVAAGGNGAKAKESTVRPIAMAAEKTLLYRAWVEASRDYVHRVSGGRLGYVHMPDMGAASLAQLSVDLDSENHARDGVVIDVRNNNGGFVNVYAIDVLARRGYLSMTPRGRLTAPARTVLGQRALEKPTILVVNQHSLSDAEDFTEGYRALKLGKVVGEPTAGWIIYTGGIALIDGSNLRLPQIRIDDSEGKPMEMHPRPVDIEVVRPIGEGLSGRDSQLDAAVKALLAQLGAK